MLKWIFRGVAALIVALGIAAAVRSGPQHALWPRLIGLHQIALNVFTDAPARADDLSAMIQRAEQTVAEFYGPLQSHPRIILCTDTPCAKRLIRGNSDVRGLTYGAQLMIMAPKGVNEMIVTHERAHAELHHFAKLSDLWDQRIPAWFDEGLASYISADDRLPPSTPAQRARIEAAKSFADWGPLVQEMGWKAAYGAAMDLVAEMAKPCGPKTISTLVQQVVSDVPFESARVQLLNATAATCGAMAAPAG